MPEPQLGLADIATSQQMHARERVAELVKIELLTNRVRLAGDWFSEASRVAMAAFSLPRFATSLRSRSRWPFAPLSPFGKIRSDLLVALNAFQVAHEA